MVGEPEEALERLRSLKSNRGEERHAGNFRDGRKIMMIFIPNEISPAAPERAGIDIVP